MDRIDFLAPSQLLTSKAGQAATPSDSSRALSEALAAAVVYRGEAAPVLETGALPNPAHRGATFARKARRNRPRPKFRTIKDRDRAVSYALSLDLPRGPRSLLRLLVEASDGSWSCWMKVATMGERLCVSGRSAQAYRLELERRGLIEVETFWARSDRQRPNTYRLSSAFLHGAFPDLYAEDEDQVARGEEEQASDQVARGEEPLLVLIEKAKKASLERQDLHVTRGEKSAAPYPKGCKAKTEKTVPLYSPARATVEPVDPDDLVAGLKGKAARLYREAVREYPEATAICVERAAKKGKKNPEGFLYRLLEKGEPAQLDRWSRNPFTDEEQRLSEESLRDEVAAYSGRQERSLVGAVA